MIDENRHWTDPDTGERFEELQPHEWGYLGCLIGGVFIIFIVVIIGLIVAMHIFLNQTTPTK